MQFMVCRTCRPRASFHGAGVSRHAVQRVNECVFTPCSRESVGQAVSFMSSAFFTSQTIADHSTGSCRSAWRRVFRFASRTGRHTARRAAAGGPVHELRLHCRHGNTPVNHGLNMQCHCKGQGRAVAHAHLAAASRDASCQGRPISWKPTGRPAPHHRACGKDAMSLDLLSVSTAGSRQTTLQRHIMTQHEQWQLPAVHLLSHGRLAA